MKLFSAYLLTALIALTTMGCKKDSESATPAPTKTELLTNRNWVLSAQTVSPGLNYNGVVVTDLYGQLAACDKDDFLRFEAPNVFKEDEGATKCNSASPQTLTGTWAFNADQTIVTITSQGGSPVSANIVELTDTSLKFTYSQSLNSVNYTVTSTYRKN